MSRYRDGFSNVGSRTDNRDTFFCSAKRKYPKKRRPGCRLPLRSSLLNGVAERGFLPLRQRAASMPHPYGLVRSKAPVLGAAYGKKPLPQLKVS
jgi:hypothetical protein